MDSELLYQISLTLVPTIGPVHAKNLIAQLGTARAIFNEPVRYLKRIGGVGEARATAIRAFRDFQAAEKEIAFLQQFSIQPLFITNPAYPKRLLHCYDCPTLLYFKGNADLNNPKVVAVVGTRTNTGYGREMTEKFIAELAGLGVMVVSGLAHGIDAIAHRSALKNGLPTLGVLAHGLNQVYPIQHTLLAREMIRQGGLLTEFRSTAIPDRHQFPSRNRIVAGMSDATVVVETGVRGGSMITAELANGYNRDVFAFPGKATDAKSAGCHHLIRRHKAYLISSAAELMENMNWEDRAGSNPEPEKQILARLTPEERQLIGLLQDRDTVHIDEINLKSGLSSSAVAAAILNMELQNIIFRHPGNMLKLAASR